jgi:hypothetical protein
VGVSVSSCLTLKGIQMDTQRPLFDTIWERFDDFEFSEETVRLCRFAQAFSDWASLVLDLGPNPNIVAVNQAKVLLVDKYFEYFSIMPKRHRYHFSPRGHVCVFQVFLQSYQHLKAIELSLTPPMLFLPPPPPPPPQIAGIFIGEEE